MGAGWGLLFFFLFFVFEFVVFPGAVIEWGDGSVARVENDFVMIGIEAGVAKIAAGGLQRVEKKAGGFVIDLIGEQHTHDLHERDLDGIGVFKDREREGGGAAEGAGFISGEADALVVKALVKETETVAAEGGRSALHAVDFNVLTTIGISGHDDVTPSRGGVVESSGWREIGF
jgi:hypothetical protein